MRYPFQTDSWADFNTFGGMKRILILSVILASVWACAENENTEEVSTSAEPEVKMAEFSELALLMKAIHADAKNWRSKLVAGELVTDSVAIYEALVTSTPTDSGVKGPVFEGLAANYQDKLNAFLAAKNADLAKGEYNNLVRACVACHSEYCPGPIPTIEKLYVPVK